MCLIGILMCLIFQDAAVDAGTTVKGGDLNLNPWLSIGGVATAFCSMSGVVE